MKAPLGSEIMNYCFQIAIKKNPYELRWGETGPVLVNHVFLKYKMTSYIANPYTFCPVNWWDWAHFIHGPLQYN